MLRRFSRPSWLSGKQLFSLVMNATLNRPVCLKLIGLINQKTGWIQVVYCGYPGNKKYLDAYASARHQALVEKYRWTPFLSGFFHHNGKLGLKFFISASEADFRAKDGAQHLQSLYQRSDQIRQWLHAKELSYAGIIPGLMFKNQVHQNGKERQKVVRAVLKGIEAVRLKLDYPQDCPVIILGAEGYIGREVMHHLSDGRCYGVDLAEDLMTPTGWPQQLEGKPAILVNISRAHQLDGYSQRVWPQLALLNEVYPEPSMSEVQRFRERGGPVFHLAGISGWSVPAFPGGYENAIPCSASWDCDEAEVEVKRLCALN